MFEIIQGICLRVVKHSDSASIATVWTRQRGPVAVSLPAGNGQAARRVRALMMPLSPFEALADFRPGREIVNLREIRQYAGGSPAAQEPVKGVVCMFLADFLYAVLRQSAPDEHLTDFLLSSIAVLRQANGTALANFHLVFLCHLGIFLGISPDAGSYTDKSIFDMQEGIFRRSIPNHRNVLMGDGARLARLVLDMDYRNMHHLKITRVTRNAILDTILNYYSLHHTDVNHLPSLEVVRGIMG